MIYARVRPSRSSREAVARGVGEILAVEPYISELPPELAGAEHADFEDAVP